MMRLQILLEILDFLPKSVEEIRTAYERKTKAAATTPVNPVYANGALHGRHCNTGERKLFCSPRTNCITAIL